MQLPQSWIKVDAVVAILSLLHMQLREHMPLKLENLSRCLSNNFLSVQADHMVTLVAKVVT